jgi:hypothetical protein
MIPQYSEGMPYFRIDDGRQTAWIDKNLSDELERFYESWTEESRVAISEDYAKGLHTFVTMMKDKRSGYIKGHITGPLTFTLGLKDGGGKPVYFDEELREISLMLLKAKIRWQIDVLKTLAEGVIIFIDEPILSALGSSSYLGVTVDETRRLLGEAVSTVKSSGGISGIHCCGNADWQLVLESGADIINFDAYDYLDAIALFPAELTNFLEKGGRLAWGIVPTSDAINKENPESIRVRLEKGIEKMSQRIPKKLILSNMLLTPSCGTGSRTVSETLKIFQILMRLKETFS